jgi:hypothetical protein
MNLQEFAALKAGDKIENHMLGGSGQGEVSEVHKMGVYVRWGESKTPFFYHINSTAWFHWSKVEPMTAELAEDLSKRAT